MGKNPMGTSFCHNQSKLAPVVFVLICLLISFDVHASYREFELFDSGYEYYLSYKPVQAVEEFKAFLREFPNSSARDAALYWLGKSYLQMDAFVEARDAFWKIEVQFPDSPYMDYVEKELQVLARMQLPPLPVSEAKEEVEVRQTEEVEVRQTEEVEVRQTEEVEASRTEEFSMLMQEALLKAKEEASRIGEIVQEGLKKSAEIQVINQRLQNGDELQDMSDSMKQYAEPPVAEAEQIVALERKRREELLSRMTESPPERKEFLDDDSPGIQVASNNQDYTERTVVSRQLPPLPQEELGAGYDEMLDSIHEVEKELKKIIQTSELNDESDEMLIAGIQYPGEPAQPVDQFPYFLNAMGIDKIPWRSGNESEDLLNEGILTDAARQNGITLDDERIKALTEKHRFNQVQSDYLQTYLLIKKYFEKRLKNLPELTMVEILSVAYPQDIENKMTFAAKLQKMAREGIPFIDISRMYPESVTYQNKRYQELPTRMSQKLKGLDENDIAVVWSGDGYLIMKLITKDIQLEKYDNLPDKERTLLQSYIKTWILDLRTQHGLQAAS
jgi:outer membrane protein assembly factor BamD (BamD/ComL family)